MRDVPNDGRYRARRDEALAPSPQADEPRTPSKLGESRPAKRRKPRLEGFDYTGNHAYHLVVVTHARRPLLVGTTAELVVSEMQRAARSAAFELLLFTVMPDHVHMLVLGTSDDSNLLRFIQKFKQLTSFRLKEHHGKPFWQQSFFDHAMRREEDVLPTARYILGNPIEAGLISPEDVWPYQGGTLLAGASRDGAKASSLRPHVEHRGASPEDKL